MKEAEFRGEHKLRTRIVLVFVVIVLPLFLVANRPSESGEVMEVRLISRDNAEHYEWGEKCDGWYLVKGPNLSVIEEQMPAGATETLHYHKQSQQFFFMLSGEATMETAGQEVRLAAGQGLHIMPGTHHRIRNSSNQPIRFLVISGPPSHGDRVNLKGVKE